MSMFTNKLASYAKKGGKAVEVFIIKMYPYRFSFTNKSSVIYVSKKIILYFQTLTTYVNPIATTAITDLVSMHSCLSSKSAGTHIMFVLAL